MVGWVKAQPSVFDFPRLFKPLSYKKAIARKIMHRTDVLLFEQAPVDALISARSCVDRKKLPCQIDGGVSLFFSLVTGCGVGLLFDERGNMLLAETEGAAARKQLCIGCRFPTGIAASHVGFNCFHELKSSRGTYPKGSV